MKKAKPQEVAPDRKPPIIFLDFDGVLHRGGASVSKATGVIQPDLYLYKLFEFEQLLATVLEPYPFVKIVLSTSWVYQKDGLRESMSRLSEGLQDRVIGSVFHDSGLKAKAFREIPRGEQVLQYVRKNDLRPHRWIALDDRDDGFEAVKHNLVKTYEYAGLADVPVLTRLYQKLNCFAWQEETGFD